MGINIVYTEAFLSRDQAEEARDNFMSEWEERLKNGELSILEDEVRYVNLHYVTRILLGKSQGEFEFD